MNKYVTVKLTEDQLRHVRHSLEATLYATPDKSFVWRILTKLDKSLAQAKISSDS